MGRENDCGNNISIHALREESDLLFSIRLGFPRVFQSTLSVRRATISVPPRQAPHSIFQSTLSVRRATKVMCDGLTVDLFQSTLSVRRATG